MNSFTVPQVQDVTNNLTVLLNTLQLGPTFLKPKQIRQADKVLHQLSSVFTQDLAAQAKQWKEAYLGHKILDIKIKDYEEKEKERQELEKSILDLKSATRAWVVFDEHEKQKLIQNAMKAQAFINSQIGNHQISIFQKYQRFNELKKLLPYADKADYLCEAIYNFENREKYQQHINANEAKITALTKQLKTIKHGVWFAVAFCFLVVTIPVCLPVIVSLWRRYRIVTSQIKNFQDITKREYKRLHSSEEGKKITWEIKELLGDVPLEQIRNTLTELKELRAEFQGPERSLNSTSALLHYIDRNQMKLTELFGPVPEDPYAQFQWLSQNIEYMQKAEEKIFALEEKKSILVGKQRQSLKGYTLELLKQSHSNLTTLLDDNFNLPYDDDIRSHISAICIQAPWILQNIRSLFYDASQNVNVDVNHWAFLNEKILELTKFLSENILHCELTQSLETKTATSHHPKLAEAPV